MARELFDLGAVRLRPSPFMDAQQADLRYLLAHDPDRLLAPYRREAGLPAVAEPYPNWESSGLSGHTAGHALSAAALLYAATGDGRAADLAEALVSGLEECQDALGSGYLGGVPRGVELWERIGSGEVSSDSFGLNGAWVPWYNLHKAVAGLIDGARYLPEPSATTCLRVAERFADWWLPIGSGLGDDAFELMLGTEFGGMCEAFADLAALTGRPDLLAMARRFADRSVLGPLLDGRDALDGRHANTQIPKVVGYQRVAELTGDEDWARAARYFWDRVVHHRSMPIGGNSVSEHFPPVDDMGAALVSREGPETCNTANMLELSRHLWLSSGDPEILDHYERATVNHILSSQHPDGGFVYFTPMRPGHYRVYSQPETAFWCCVGTGLETHARYGELVFARDGEDLAVNLLVPAVLRWPERALVAELESTYPDLGAVTATLTLRLAAPATLGISLRRPWWAAQVEVTVNGARVDPVPTAGRLALHRTWQDGDTVGVRMEPELAVERLPDGSAWGCVRYGPTVLALPDDRDDLDGLRADDSRLGHIAAGPLRPTARTPVLELADDGSLVGTSSCEGPGHVRLRTGDRELDLVPFHSLHDRRYTLAFPLARPGEAEQRSAALAEIDALERDIEARTIDVVACGRQQPESDHGLQGEGSAAGSDGAVHWRSAHDWFGFRLQDRHEEGVILRFVVRSGGGASTVLLDDELCGHIRPAPGDALVTREVPVVPRRGGRVLRVKATDAAGTVEVVEVRLLRR